LLNNQHVKTAIHLLKNARRIHFVGVGASSIIAQDAQQKFSRIDKDAYAFSDMHLAATLVANASDDDVVVGISFSGETKEVAKIIELAKNKGIKTVSLTKYGNSTVAQHASINLYTSASYEPTFRSGATSSRMAQLQVIDIMFMGVASSLYDHTLQSLDATREAVQFLSEKKKECGDNVKNVIEINGGGTSIVASLFSSEGKLIKTVKLVQSNQNKTSKIK